MKMSSNIIYLKYGGGINSNKNRFMLDANGIFCLDVNGTPYHIDEHKKPTIKIENYAVEITSFVNSLEEHIRFYTNPKTPKVLIVYNESIHIELIYTIGTYNFLDIDSKEQQIPSKITNFAQVISAFRSENITF